MEMTHCKFLFRAARRQMGVRHGKFTRSHLLYQANFQQGIDCFLSLSLGNRGAQVPGNLLHIYNATIQFQVSTHGRDPPILEQLELGGLQTVAIHVTKIKGLGHQFFAFALVLGYCSGEEQVKVFGLATGQIQDFFRGRERMSRKVLLFLQHAIKVAGIQPQLIPHHTVRIERHLSLSAIVVLLQEVAIIRYVRKRNHNFLPVYLQ